MSAGVQAQRQNASDAVDMPCPSLSVFASSMPLSTEKIAPTTIHVKREREGEGKMYNVSFMDRVMGPQLEESTGRRLSITASTCRAIVTQLHALQEIPECLRESSRLGRLEDPEEAAKALEEALAAVDQSLQLSIHAANDAIAAVDAENALCSSELATAEAQLATQKQLIIDRKAALSDSARALKPKADAAAVADAAMKEAESEFKAAVCKQRKLEAAATDACAPLKDAPVSGPEGRKMVQVLKKVGNEYGFHPELMSVLPAIARKQLDKRRTFDDVALKLLGTEFQRHADTLKSTAAEAERSVARLATSAQEARVAWVAAKELQQKLTQDISEAEAAMPKFKDAAATIKRRSRAQVVKSGASRTQLMKRLAKAKARYEKFRHGPLAAFERNVLPPPSSAVASVSAPCVRGRADERLMEAVPAGCFDDDPVFALPHKRKRC